VFVLCLIKVYFDEVFVAVKFHVGSLELLMRTTNYLGFLSRLLTKWKLRSSLTNLWKIKIHNKSEKRIS
jgi:hypothetical protein